MSCTAEERVIHSSGSNENKACKKSAAIPPLFFQQNKYSISLKAMPLIFALTESLSISLTEVHGNRAKAKNIPLRGYA